MLKRKANRVHRACFSCRKRKQGCDEERPCKRCTEKGMECLEVEADERKKISRHSSEEEMSSEDEHYHLEDDAHEEDTHSHEEDECDSDPEETGEAIGSSDERVSTTTRERAPSVSSPLNDIPGTPTSDEETEESKPKQWAQLALLLPFLSSFMEDALMSSEEDDTDFRQAKDMWSEIIRCLRSLEWNRLQSYLSEVDSHCSFSDKAPAVLFWSSGGRIQYANSALSRMLGFTAEELRTRDDKWLSAHALFHPEDCLRISQRQLESLQSSEHCCYHTRTRLISKSRHEVPVNATISNVRDSSGTPLLTVAHFSSMYM